LKGSFAAYPYGVKRYDTSGETRRYAGTPRDDGVGLDAMGARSYASDLGVWTGPDPVGVSDPGQGIGRRFSASNPYGYGSNSPVTYIDKQGEWAFLAVAAVVVGITIVSQYANAPTHASAPLYHKSNTEMAVEMTVNSAAMLSLGRTATGIATSCARQGFARTGSQTLVNVAKSEVKDQVVDAAVNAIDPSGTLGTAVGVVSAARSLSGGGSSRIGSGKAPPNPHGRKGGPAHQAKVAEVAEDVKSRGLRVKQEHQVKTPEGEKGSRYVDVVGKDADGNVVEMHQIGRQTRSGAPVAREARAIRDIEHATGQNVQFHAYNGGD